MKTQEIYTLPTELASLFINGDWSIVDYIDDDLYEEAINTFLRELEFENLEIISIVEDTNRFVKYHDMMDYGVLACDCSDYILWRHDHALDPRAPWGTIAPAHTAGWAGASLHGS